VLLAVLVEAAAVGDMPGGRSIAGIAANLASSLLIAVACTPLHITPAISDASGQDRRPLAECGVGGASVAAMGAILADGSIVLAQFGMFTHKLSLIINR
jgi:hypothetical protein